MQDYDDTLRAKLIEAKANYDGSFKEFVEKHTHISLTTAKRTLRIADGRGEEVRQQERERQQRHRGRDNPPVTPSPPITAAEGVKLVASQGVTMTEPEVAECLRLAEMPEAEFEEHVEDTKNYGASDAGPGAGRAIPGHRHDATAEADLFPT